MCLVRVEGHKGAGGTLVSVKALARLGACTISALLAHPRSLATEAWLAWASALGCDFHLLGPYLSSCQKPCSLAHSSPNLDSLPLRMTVGHCWAWYSHLEKPRGDVAKLADGAPVMRMQRSWVAERKATSRRYERPQGARWWGILRSM